MTLVPGKLYAILDKKIMMYYQELRPKPPFKLKIDANKPILFLSATTVKKLESNSTKPYYQIFYKFLIENKIISFNCYSYSYPKEKFLPSIKRIS